MNLATMNDDDRYTVAGYGGVAFYFAGPQTAPDADTVWTGIEEQTGYALMVMVGDDREHVIDPDDVSPIAADAYCRECGQIGCGWNVAE